MSKFNQEESYTVRSCIAEDIGVTIDQVRGLIRDEEVDKNAVIDRLVRCKQLIKFFKAVVIDEIIIDSEDDSLADVEEKYEGFLYICKEKAGIIPEDFIVR